MTDPHLPDHQLKKTRRRLAIADLLKYTAWFVFAGLLLWIAFQNNQNGDLLVDCTTPGHKCYEDAQRRAGDIVGEPAGPINTVFVIGLACADKPGQQTDAEIFDCVIRELQARADERSHR